MNASNSYASPRPHHRSRLYCMSGLFMKNLAKIQLLQAENRSPKEEPKEDGISIAAIGAVTRSAKIDNARIIVSTMRHQRQEQQAPTSPSASSSSMRNALVERLETKLLANEMECTELRKLTEARKRGIPVSLASLDLGCDPENGDNDVLLQKLEALFLEKENKCTKVRKLLAEARKRDSPKCVLPLTPMKAPMSIVRPPASPRSGNSVTWGVNRISL
jgi:hypothetical protein